LGKLGRDKLSQFFNRLTLCSLVSLSINESHVGIAVTQHILLRLERQTVVVQTLQIAPYPNPWSLSTCKNMPCLETSFQQPLIPDSEGLSRVDCSRVQSHVNIQAQLLSHGPYTLALRRLASPVVAANAEAVRHPVVGVVDYIEEHRQACSCCGRPAVERCRQCGCPLCDDCVAGDEG